MDTNFIWKETYSLGVDMIDEQHQHLFAIANSLPNHLDAEVAAKAILELYRYTRVHFKDEEKAMKESGYPNYEDHRRIHDDLIEKLASIKGRDFANTENLLEFKKFVYDWIITHIMSEDRKLAQYLNREITEKG